MRYLAAFAILVAACSSDPRRPGGPGGGGADMAGGGGGGGGDGCSDEARLVYVVDQNNKLSSFNPQTLAFNDIGTLSCPAQLLATPFSMAVDRQATAWVLYSSGELFTVNTQTLDCQKTSWASQGGLVSFGMGFATDTAGGTAETLFIAGGGAGGPAGGMTSTLAKLALPGLTASPLGTIQGWPELTGTGAAELWGFFPGTSPRIARINKQSGAGGPVFPLANIGGQPRAWAFAFWGGEFCIFLQRGNDEATSIYRFPRSGGTTAATLVVKTADRRIVGAGVSTCAPVKVDLGAPPDGE